MQHKEIQRWLDGGPDVPKALCDAVRAARAEAPTEEQLQRIVERATSATGVSASATAEASWSVFVAAGGAVLAAGLAMLWLHGSAPARKAVLRSKSDSHETSHQTAAVPSVGSDSRTVIESAALTEPQPADASPTANARVVTADRVASARAIGRVPLSAAKVARGGMSALEPRDPTGSTSDPTAEIRLLQAAQRDLANAPARAYQRLLEHEHRYRASAFVEEREALVVEALGRMGQMAEARRRAAGFQKHFPNSAYWRRITEVLQKSTQL
jgi:hypothetical protein